MKFIHSLGARYIFLSALILAFFSMLVFASFQLTRHSRGESRKINLAGRQRMQIYHIASHMHLLATSYPGLKIEAVDGLHRTEVNLAGEEYGAVLYALRGGDKKLNLEAIHPHDQESLVILTRLVDRWETTQKPLLQRLVHAPVAELRYSCTACHAAFIKNIDALDALADSLSVHYEQELQSFVRIRLYILVSFFLLAVVIGVYVRRQFVRPIIAMKQAADRIRQKDFAVQLPVTGRNEISALALTLNEMASTLADLFKEKDENNQRLSMLFQVGAVASRTLHLDTLLHDLLDEIFRLEIFALQKKGGIFLYDKEKKVLNLVVSRGYGPEQLKGCGTVEAGQCLCGLAAENKQVIRSTSSADHRHTLTYEGVTDHGHLVLPLMFREQLLGVLCLYLPAGITVSTAEEEALRSVADIVAMALQNSLIHQRTVMLAQALDSSRDLILLADLQGVVIHANPMTYDYFGCQPKEMLGQQVFTTHSPNNPVGLEQEIFSQTLTDGWNGELFFVRRDGSEYPVLLTTAPVRDEHGTVVALLGIARDITERKRMEERIIHANQSLGRQVQERTAELEEAKQLAEAANRAKSEFLANMSHELRTPLNSILGFVDLIRDGMAGPTTDNQREYLGDVLDSSKHLLSLINDILDLSKVEAGHTELEISSIAVADLVEHSLVMFKEKAMKHNIALAVNLPDDLGEIRADERKIKQVLVNLLANAMKFTPDGGRVAVEVVREADGIRITIRDNGIGIAQEDLPRLFQPFQQLETELSRKYPGTGLGLSLCRKLVELHGGRIWAESELGAGSSFVFLLPDEPTSVLNQEKSRKPLGSGILAWQAGRQHINRLISLGQREKVEFALLRYHSAKPVSRNVFLLATKNIQAMIRGHDLIMADADRQEIWLVIVGAEGAKRAEALSRFRGVLEETGDLFVLSAAFYPEDGDSSEALLAALDARMTPAPRRNNSGEPV